jgi:dienelactone hydrolase
MTLAQGGQGSDRQPEHNHRRDTRGTPARSDDRRAIGGLVRRAAQSPPNMPAGGTIGAMKRVDAEFASDRATCAAWLYVPDGDGPFPAVVLAHGWTGVREQRLDAFAVRFAEAGLAAVVFDYRHFGASSGEPRQLLDIKRQLADWAAAVTFARSRAEIDSARIALWGTSFSGGHVIETAARDPQIAAVVAQAPFADGLRNLPSLGVRLALRLTAAGLRDQIGAVLGRPPHMVASVGPPGSLAVMTTPDAEPGFRGIDPPGSSWRNEAAARIALRVSTYRPGRHSDRIAGPILFAIAEDDAITPPAFARASAARARHSEVRTYPGGHFDVYVGAGFERAVADQVDFLSRHLLRR